MSTATHEDSDGTGYCRGCGTTIGEIHHVDCDIGDYYVHRNSGNSVFVKEGAFFVEQGGLVSDCGKGWTKVRATSIEDARRLGDEIL